MLHLHVSLFHTLGTPLIEDNGYSTKVVKQILRMIIFKSTGYFEN